MATVTATSFAPAPASATRAVTINAAFMQEIKEVNQELWQLLAELQQRCQRPIAPHHCKPLIDDLCELRDQLALHFALEEAYGYFEDPVDVAPQLSKRAGKLRAEHKSLYADFCRLIDRAEQMFYDGQQAELTIWIGPHFLRAAGSLRSHEARETELLYEAYDSDIGVGD